MRKKRDDERDNSQLRKRIYYFGAAMLAVKILIIAAILSGCTEDTIDKSGEFLSTAGVEEVFPANFAESVEVNPVIGVAFNPGTPAAKIAASSLTLKNGPDEIPGKVTVSGFTALFTYDHDLKPNSQYTATLRAASDGSKGDDDSFEYSWKFKTGNDHKDNSLMVVSVDPANKTINVPVGTNVSVTLNKEIKSWMKGMISVTLQAGSTSVAGLISVSDKVVKFDPSSNLASNTVYTGKFTYGPNEWISNQDDDDDDDDKSTGAYTWTFTTTGGGTTTNNDVTPPVVSSVAPANNATSVATGSTVNATFSEPMNASTITTSTFGLKQGATVITGTVTYSGNTASFKPSAALSAGAVYTATVTNGVKDVAGNAMAANYTWNFTTASAADVTAPTVASVTPANNATSVATNTSVTATFSETMNSSTISSSTFSLKQGATAVSGTVTYSGNTATLKPAAALAAGTVYTATITNGVKDAAGNSLAANYTWSFTTAAAVDATAPTVTSVTPANGATSVATSTKVTVTFSEPMNSSTISSSTVSLKQGSTTISGVVTYSGNVATLTPSAALAAGTTFTATVSTGVRDAAGNALAIAYSWSFTTAVAADVTPPTVVSVTPLNNATSVATNSKVTASFSEAMNSGSITTTTFTLKQGSTSVTGTVTYSGTVATFTPAAALSSGAVYTATVTTGVRDAAGNSMASNYSWSFTTVAAPAGVSFASVVAPILINNCNGCHTHKWTVSSNASTFYNNLANAGYISSTNPTSGQIYIMLNGGHASSIPAERTKVLTWISEGSKNN